MNIDADIVTVVCGSSDQLVDNRRFAQVPECGGNLSVIEMFCQLTTSGSTAVPHPGKWLVPVAEEGAKAPSDRECRASDLNNLA